MTSNVKEVKVTYSDNPTPNVSNTETVFTEEQLERVERRRSVNNGIIHSYNVETIFTEGQPARRGVHLNAVLRNGIHAGIFPVVLITCNYNSAMSTRVSGERRGRLLSNNLITQTNNTRTIFNVEQLARSECLQNCFPDNSVIHGHNVAQVVIEEQVPSREGSNTVFSGDECRVSECRIGTRNAYEICMTVFSDHSVAGVDNMQTVFTKEQTER